MAFGSGCGTNTQQEDEIKTWEDYILINVNSGLSMEPITQRSGGLHIIEWIKVESPSFGDAYFGFMREVQADLISIFKVLDSIYHILWRSK